MTKVECPVCGKTDLADQLVQCPQCNADLECFRLLDTLYEVPSTPSVDEDVLKNLSQRVQDIGPLLQSLQDGMRQLQRAAKRRTGMLLLAILILGLMIAAGVWRLFWHGDMSREPTDVMSSATLRAELVTERPTEKALREAVAQAVAGIEQLNQQVATLEQRVEELAVQSPETTGQAVAAAEPEPSFLMHQPRKNESLWLIAQQHYQQGMLYPALLETNPGLGIYFDPDYGQLRLPPDRQAAEAIVARVVFTKNAKRFFRYPVQVADTWRIIAERFYGRGDNIAWLQALNTAAQPQPGTRVVVPLPE